MKGLTFVVVLFMNVALMTTQASVGSAISVGTTDYATVGALFDSGDYLLIGTEFGITKLNKSNGEMEFYCDRLNGLPSDRVTALTIDNEGNIWVGYNDESAWSSDTGGDVETEKGGGLAKFDGSCVTVFNKYTSDLPMNTILSLATDSDGNVWIGTEAGLTKYDGTVFTTYDKSNSDIPHRVVNDISASEGGKIVIGTNFGLGIYDGETWASYNEFDSDIPSNLVRCVSNDSQGNIWTGTSRGVAFFDGENWTVYKQSDTGLSSDNVLKIDNDGEGNTWICTENGIAKYNGTAWESMTGDVSCLSDHDVVESFTVDSDGRVWVGTYDCLLKFDGSTWLEQKTGALTGKDTWSRIADMPTERAGANLTTVNGKIYVIGGKSNNVFMSTVEMYDPAACCWTTKSSMSTARSTMGVCEVNGKIYAIGGSPNLRNVEEYDPATDTWASKKPMPTGRSNVSCCVLNGIIYVIGGLDNPTFETYSIVEAYDPSTNTWVTKAPMSDARCAFTSSVVNGKIYVLGGFVQPDNPWTYTITSVEEYNPATNSWTYKTDMPTSRGGTIGVAIDEKIYVTGGQRYDWDLGNIHDYMRQIEVYDPATDTWTTLSKMPVNTMQGGACALDGKIYVAVGWKSNGGQYYKTMYVYDTPEKSTGVESVHVTTPNTFSLSQNYPNPFNPTTVISYSLDRQGLVNLIIYDILGRKVDTLVDTNQGPGTYSVRWDADGLASGVYFYQMDIDGKIQKARRMMLMK